MTTRRHGDKPTTDDRTHAACVAEKPRCTAIDGTDLIGCSSAAGHSGRHTPKARVALADPKPCPCGGPMYEGVPMHKLDCPVLHGKPLK